MMTDEQQARWEAAVNYEVKNLQAEIERLRTALNEICRDVPGCDIHYQGTIAINIAKAALRDNEQTTAGDEK